MSAIHMEVSPQAGSVFDGTTFVAPADFTYGFVGANRLTAQRTAVGAVGVIDPMGMIMQLADLNLPEAPEFQTFLDELAAGAQNKERITDVVVVRGLVEGTGLTVAGTDVGSHTPPLSGFPTGVRDQQTPNTYATGNVNVAAFGGVQYISTAAVGVRGGAVVLPTGYRFFCVSDGDSNPPVLHLWLVPLYTCECWAALMSTPSETGPVP